MFELLLFGVLVLFGFCYIKTGKDLLNPACILSLFSLFAIIVATSNYYYWELKDYSWKTTALFLLGMYSFAIGSLLATKRNMQSKAFYLRSHSNIGPIHISKRAFVILHIIMLLSFIVFLYFYRTQVSNFSAAMFAEFKEYRNDEDESLPTHINLIYKFIQIFALLDMFIFINNVQFEKFWRNVGYLVTPVILFVMALFVANRGDILLFLMASFSCWYIVQLRVKGFGKRLRRKVVKSAALLGGAFLIFFWLLVFLLQADNEVAQNSMLFYVSNYVSGPVASFDLYIKQGGESCQWWGQETFVTLNNNLASFGLGHKSERFLEFRDTIGYAVTNIYSSFRRFYHDFGNEGLILLSLFQGWISTRFYNYVLTKSFKSVIDFPLCVFCYLFYTIPYTFIDELFYSSNVSISGIYKIALFYIVYKAYFLTQKRQNSLKIVKA